MLSTTAYVRAAEMHQLCCVSGTHDRLATLSPQAWQLTRMLALWGIHNQSLATTESTAKSLCRVYLGVGLGFLQPMFPAHSAAAGAAQPRVRRCCRCTLSSPSLGWCWWWPLLRTCQLASQRLVSGLIEAPPVVVTCHASMLQPTGHAA